MSKNCLDCINADAAVARYLIVQLAWEHCDRKLSGEDGDKYMFCAEGYPETHCGCGDTKFEAALMFLKEEYGF